jgi:hypothetical protein
MEVGKYKELKEKGLIKLAKIGNSYAYEKKKFDPDTGAAVSPEVAALDLKWLEQQKETLLSQVTNIDEIIKDCQALK